MKNRVTLTDDQVMAVWHDLRPAKILAEVFGCAPATIWTIRDGSRHSSLTGGENPNRIKLGKHKNRKQKDA